MSYVELINSIPGVLVRNSAEKLNRLVAGPEGSLLLLNFFNLNCTNPK